MSDCIFEIHQLWQSGFSRVYSNSCFSCLFGAEIIKIVLSSHNMYSNSILNFQESTTILSAHTKKPGNLSCAPRTYISYITFVIHPPLMMAQSWAESTWEITNYGRFINQFPPNIVRSIRKFERINKKVCWQKNICYVQSNVYIYISVYMCICVCINVCVCVCVCVSPVHAEQILIKR